MTSATAQGGVFAPAAKVRGDLEVLDIFRWQSVTSVMVGISVKALIAAAAGNYGTS